MEPYSFAISRGWGSRPHPPSGSAHDQFTRYSGVTVNEYAYLRMGAKHQHSDLRVVRSYIQSRDNSLHKFFGVPEVGRSDTPGIIQDEYNVFRAT